MKTLKMMTDEELVVLYAEGNNAAFDILLNRYKSSIHSYIYFIVRNKELTEDIFQETFVKVIMTIKQGRYTENGKFKAWITRIAHNLIIDNFRQERCENTISNDEVEIDLFNNSKLCDGTIEDKICLLYTSVCWRKTCLSPTRVQPGSSVWDTPSGKCRTHLESLGVRGWFRNG